MKSVMAPFLVPLQFSTKISSLLDLLRVLTQVSHPNRNALMKVEGSGGWAG